MNVVIILAAVAILQFTAIAQQNPVRTRWFRTGTDSILVEYAKTAGAKPRPAVVVLPDRFGSQPAVSSILAILARQGFHAYAIPLRSAPQQAVAGIPPVSVDSLDYRAIAEIAAEINGDPDCSGRVGLLGFDVGATLGAMVAARLPLFRASVLFYPAFAARMQLLIPDIDSPVLISIAEYDADFSLARMNEIKEACIEKGRRVKATFYKEAKRFFFNPRHEHSHKRNTQEAWKALLGFFRERLR